MEVVILTDRISWLIWFVQNLYVFCSMDEWYVLFFCDYNILIYMLKRTCCFFAAISFHAHGIYFDMM
jgi:hypothetical protein